VFYSKGGLLVTTGRYKALPGQDANFLRAPFADLEGAINSLDPHAFSEMLGPADSVLVGAKDFRAPEGLGDVQSHFCYIVVLAPSNPSILSQYMEKFGNKAVANGPLWKWSVEPAEGRPAPMQLYATQVTDHYLLVSNSVDDLRVMTQKLRATSSGLVTPSGVREWETISQHDVWGYRRYRLGATEDKGAAGVEDVMPGTDALAFFVNPWLRTSVLWLFSSTAGTPEKINADHTLPPFHRIRGDLWQARIYLAGDKCPGQMFSVMGLFGFGIYL
jgi:hypothetical protein